MPWLLSCNRLAQACSQAVGYKRHSGRASLSGQALFKPLLASHLIIFIGQSKSYDQAQRRRVGALSQGVDAGIAEMREKEMVAIFAICHCDLA